MQSVWLGGLALVAAITVRFWWATGRLRRDDLGVVSQQWLAEHRQSESYAERR
jgi:hypothetical protein